MHGNVVHSRESLIDKVFGTEICADEVSLEGMNSGIRQDSLAGNGNISPEPKDDVRELSHQIGLLPTRIR